MKNGHKKKDCRKFLKWRAKKEKSEDHSTKAVQENSNEYYFSVETGNSGTDS